MPFTSSELRYRRYGGESSNSNAPMRSSRQFSVLRRLSTTNWKRGSTRRFTTKRVPSTFLRLCECRVGGERGLIVSEVTSTSAEKRARVAPTGRSREGGWGTHPGLLVEVESVQGDVTGAAEDLLDVRILALQHLQRGLILDLLVKQRLLASRPHVDRSLRALGRPKLSRRWRCVRSHDPLKTRGAHLCVLRATTVSCSRAWCCDRPGRRAKTGGNGRPPLSTRALNCDGREAKKCGGPSEGRGTWPVVGRAGREAAAHEPLARS